MTGERIENTPTAHHAQSQGDHLISEAYSDWGKAFKSPGAFFYYGNRAAAEANLGLQIKGGEVLIGAFDYVGHSIMSGIHEFAHENPELAAANRRVAEFAQTRPATYATEMMINPGLAQLDGLIRGGLPRQASEAAPQPHPQAANPQPADNHARRNEPATDNTPKPASNEGHDPHTAAVHKGDGYWRIARRILGAEASNRDVLKLTKELEEKNGNRLLHAGEEIKV